MLHEYRAKTVRRQRSPLLVHVSTPSYSGTHIDGFHDAVRAVVEQLAEAGASPSAYVGSFVNLFPGMVSAEDLRFLKEVAADFATADDAVSRLLGDARRAVDGEVPEDSRGRHDDCGAARHPVGEGQH